MRKRQTIPLALNGKNSIQIVQVVQEKMIKRSSYMRCVQYDGQNGIKRVPRVGILYITFGSCIFFNHSGGFCIGRLSLAGLGKHGL
jgi:hypothetical protein